MMANLTEEEEERREPQPHVKANIPAIAAMLDNNGSIARAEEKGQKARSDLGNLYKKIENDFHGHRGAAKLIRTLNGGTVDAAYDFMRTFIPLAQHFGLIPDNDLADMGEGGEPGAKVFEFPGKSALDKAKTHLSGGTKPEPEVQAAEEAAAKKKRDRKATHGFDENPPAGAPGDEDLANPGVPKTDEGDTVQ